MPEPVGDVPPAAAAATLFEGVRGLAAALDRVHARAVTRDARRPLMGVLPDLEATVLERYRGGGFGGPVRNVAAFGFTGHVPLAPQAMAALLLRPDVAREVLAASSVTPTGTVFRVPGASRRTYHVEMLRQGMGPFRYDLRFAVAVERWDVADGTLLARYDPQRSPRTEHVTLYRGAVRIEPVDGGSRVTEVVVLGTDIQVPMFFAKSLRQFVVTTLRNRAINLWKRAWR